MNKHLLTKIHFSVYNYGVFNKYYKIPKYLNSLKKILL